MWKEIRKLFIKDAYQKLDIEEYYRLRGKKVSFIFVLIITVFMGSLIPVLIFLLNSISAAIGLSVGIVGSLICLVFILKGNEKIGSAIQILIVQFSLIAVMASSVFIMKNEEIGYVMITVVGLFIGMLIPSGILVSNKFTIVSGLITTVSLIVVPLVRNEPALTRRIPLMVGTMLIVICLIYFITHLQNQLMTMSLLENKKNRKSLEEIKGMIFRIKSIRDRSDSVQTAINSGLSEIKEIINTYSQKITVLFESSVRLTAIADATQKNLGILVAAVNNITNQINTQSSLVKKNSATQESMFSDIQQITGNIKKADDINVRLNSTMALGKESVSGSMHTVQQLDAYKDQMMDVINVLNTIAEQTNMLAMNASIEAAHAGAAGVGFAIVANEVRTLADNAGNQTGEIETIIRQMNSKISESVSFIKKSDAAILDISEISKQSYSAISEISKAMDNFVVGNRNSLDGTNQLVTITSSVQNSAVEEEKVSSSVIKDYDGLKSYFNELNDVIGNLKEYNERTVSILENITRIISENDEMNRNINQLLSEYTEEKIIS